MRVIRVPDGSAAGGSAFVPLARVRGALGVAVVVLGALAIALGARIDVPMEPVPMSLQTLAVLVVGALAGARRGLAAVAAYLGAAALGLPVLAGGEGGLARLAGPTAGYLAGFALAACFVGALAERGWTAPRAGEPLGRALARSLGAMLLGHALVLACGAAWLATRLGPAAALERGVTPFLLGAVVKSALAVAAVELVRRARGR